MIWRTLTLLLAIICCTDKPESSPPGASDATEQQQALYFTGLDGALKHNVPFSVSVTVNEDISAAADGQALTITLSRRGSDGNWQPAGEKEATNNSATFDLTLPAGDYTLKAETSGAATLSQESQTFTVSTESVERAVGEVKLSFSEDSYTIKKGALFDVTIDVTDSEKLEDDSRVALKLLKDDDSETGMLMQWQRKAKEMQLPGAAVAIEVDKDTGKAEFKDLFVVDDKDVAKLQAVLEHDGKSVVAEAKFSSTASEVMTFKNIEIVDQANNTLKINTDPAASNQTSTSIYFFNNNANPVTVHGAHDGDGAFSGSGQQQVVNNSTADLDKYCYDLAVKFIEDKHAFLQHGVVNGNPDCK